MLRHRRSGGVRTGREGRGMDLVFVGLILLFLAASWAFVKLCERV
jgi:hypothetical protein